MFTRNAIGVSRQLSGGQTLHKSLDFFVSFNFLQHDTLQFFIHSHDAELLFFLSLSLQLFFIRHQSASFSVIMCIYYWYCYPDINIFASRWLALYQCYMFVPFRQIAATETARAAKNSRSAILLAHFCICLQFFFIVLDVGRTCRESISDTTPDKLLCDNKTIGFSVIRCCGRHAMRKHYYSYGIMIKIIKTLFYWACGTEVYMELREENQIP